MAQLGSKRKSVPVIGITCRNARDLPDRSGLYERAIEKAGGSPALYNDRKLFSLEIEDPQRIDFEMTLLREIMSLNKPILGICYGMQLINVFFGGTLYRDVLAQVEKSLDHREKIHSIIMQNNPYIRSGEFQVGSSHHEAVKRAGRGIIPFAYAPDAVIEAFYLAKYGFLLGVQWHPERMESPVDSALFERFVEVCLD